jgi:hypothetical protein
MNLDRARVSRYLTEITKNSQELNALIAAHRLTPYVVNPKYS